MASAWSPVQVLPASLQNAPIPVSRLYIYFYLDDETQDMSAVVYVNGSDVAKFTCPGGDSRDQRSDAAELMARAWDAGSAFLRRHA